MEQPKKYWRVVLGAHSFAFGVVAIIVSFVFLATVFIVSNGKTLGPTDSHVVNLYVDGQTTTIPSRAATVKDFLGKAGVILREADLVEPVLETPITEDNFNIQVYRARPVTIIDGSTVKRVLTPHTGAKTIAQKAGFTVYNEDILTLTTATNFTQDMIFGEKLIITRAIPVTLSLYGVAPITYRTQASTVEDFLYEQDIVPEDGATVIPDVKTSIIANLPISISKFGKQVAAVEEAVPFEIESTPDPTQAAGIISIIKPGVEGKKQVVYEIIMQDGQEIGRNVIQEVITELPQTQLQIIGTKANSILTASRGVNQFIDSHGVQHRETFYDLPMGIVMSRYCDGGGYTVRSDGVKVDKEGYVIVAASLISYNRCEIVETSLGPAKIYDTGGFALIHPYGFDVATDWSNGDGI